jgi:hypothetical protein
MLRPASNTPNQMADPFELKAALHFPVDRVTHKGRLAPLLGSGAAP